MKLLVLFLLVLTFGYIESLKVLVIYPLPVKSLSILGEGAVRHLSNAGHEVTYITVFPMKKPPTKNFRQIDISSNMVLFEGEYSQFGMQYILEHGLEGNSAQSMQELGRENSRNTFNHENVKKLLENTNEHFDVVISDFFESEVYAGLAVLYNCPMVWLYSMGAHWQVIRLIDEARNPAYDPDYLSPYVGKLSFTERVDGLWARIKWQYFKIFVTMPIERAIYEQTFGPLLAQRGKTLPDYEEVIYNSSLIFGNEHNAVKHRPSTPQNFKYIGGFHIQDPVNPLPKDLQDLIDSSKEGVIYFSMGSFWKSKEMPIHLTRAILKVFGELKQTVIWKYEEDLPDVPKNVRIVHWAPQPSILAHPNCKFFITHGGLLSSIEAIHFGVPVIGIPVMFDQHTNVKKAIENGYALLVNLDYDLPKNLKLAINEMLSDDKYSRKAKELSFIYHDRPVKPGAELVHWVQHVVRTRGAQHLRSPALHVPLYQRLYLDLLALLGGIVSILYIAIGNLCKKRSKKVDNKKVN